MKNIKEELLRHNIRPTYQRLQIMKYLRGTCKHPTVDDIYEKLRKDIPTMSRTTVYNTLHKFVEHGLVREVFITGSENHFDCRTENHHHFQCELCGAIIDLDIDCCHATAGMVHGHKINEMHGYFKGICKSCLEAESTKTGENE